MCCKWLGIDGKGYANTTYISEFHPHIPEPWFRNIYVIFIMFCTCFGTPNRVSPIIHEKCLTGIGYIDADWKVSALKMKICSDPWTESSKNEFKHLLTTKSWIWGLLVFSDWVAKRFPALRWLHWPPRLLWLTYQQLCFWDPPLESRPLTWRPGLQGRARIGLESGFWVDSNRIW